MGKFDTFIQIKFLRPLRLKSIVRIINNLQIINNSNKPNYKTTILDIGCMDDYILKKLDSKFDYTGIDNNPLCDNKQILKLRVEDFLKSNLRSKRYDIVLCTEVLEHLNDPISIINKIKRLSKRFIIISVPNEPFFSLFRFFVPAREHLWTIFPLALERHFGKPIYSKKACFNRTHIAVWDIKK